ncbi:translation initiation factor IF-3 [Candidatus Liberibacter asiaticus]|nr:translation initiation factor IF-3 [Candidatus Liberibacter asiaticus]KAE9510456.1 Translation initiation factor IF-3 [Candidatus Liberibacter asiaticus]KAE9512597.1 Translation initiation factor IF-3 [Candidatus Liberibacter asiaticus]KAE9513725.1 Translation initiation factor IF-3 [Candidatus Liberibacter asiaticus]KAE9514751.1 Translation initiation factor IF-3 [Candidatus Liberibacter asiaticus]KAE9516845.1 Translation initiation factor IF-3 [Candidatus Liberibacter asiaticus]
MFGEFFLARDNMAIRKVCRSSKLDVGSKDNYRVNDEVLLHNPGVIKLVTADGQNANEISASEALQMAQEANLDLVEIDSSVTPSVCKILDLRKLRYTIQKNAVEARKKQKSTGIKEVKMRPVIDLHDLQVKLKAIDGFLRDGCKVKISVKFRGREIMHQDLGRELLSNIKERFGEISRIDCEPKFEGRQMIMILSSKCV